MHALGVKKTFANAGAAMTEAERAAKRFGVFERICAKHGYTPTTLSKTPADRLKQLVCAEGFPVPMPTALVGWAEEYAAAKSSARN